MTFDIQFQNNCDQIGFTDVTPLKGATFTPSVSDDGILSWSNDQELENPAPVSVRGEPGADGADGVDGYTPVKGVDYFTEAEKAEFVEQAQEQWQLLADTTTTEEIINFAIDTDMDGNPFSCRKIVAQVTLPQTMDAAMQVYWGNALAIWGGNPYAMANVTWASCKIFLLEAEMIRNNFALFRYHERIEDHFMSRYSGDGLLRSTDVASFTKFCISNEVTGNPLPIGTHFKVWGCKA